MYAISEVLGTHHLEDTDWLPSMHNLMYANKDAYKGSKSRYIREECSLPISKREFMNYFNVQPQHKVAVFITYVDKTGKPVNVMKSVSINPLGNNLYSVTKHDASHAEGRYSTLNRLFNTADRSTYNVEDLWELLFKHLTAKLDNNEIWVYPDPFNDPDYGITFDVVTLYEILTSRGQCTRLVKNYAKNMVSRLFNEYVNKLSHIEAFSQLNIYLYYNAEILGISDNYRLLEKNVASYFSGYDDHIDATASLRNGLINIIQDTIMNMD